MKIKIHELTETSVLFQNLDSPNCEHRCRIALSEFKNEYTVIEIINEPNIEEILKAWQGLNILPITVCPMCPPPLNERPFYDSGTTPMWYQMPQIVCLIDKKEAHK